MMDDVALLRCYAEERSEQAFAELVRRQVNLVYCAALRQTSGDAALAEDVTQTVFTDLARKAGRLTGRPVLAGWLHTSTRLAAAEALRAQRRRQVREHEAHVMHELAHDPAAATDWERLRPVIDDALHALGERDCEAVSLRFFENRPFAEVGAKLSLTEDTARVRVARALDRMHAALARRGVTSTAAALGAALANQAGAAAPAGLAASVTGVALAGAAASGGAGAVLAGIFTMSKITNGIVGALVVAITAVGIVELRADRQLRAELGTLPPGGNLALLQKENRQLNTALQKLGATNPEANEVVRLQQRAAVLRARPPGVVDSEFKKASTWRNVGRATPEAANETFMWAVFTGDRDAVANLVGFDDDTPENRAAYMACFSDAVQARYRTPERLFAAIVFDGVISPDDSFQVLSVDENHVGDGHSGQLRVHDWFSPASGKEFEGGDRWKQTPDGWLIAGPSLLKEAKAAADGVYAGAFDPLTGNRLPRPHRP